MAGKQQQNFINDHNHSFITEKMYMILQLFLNNKSTPSVELVNLLQSSDNFNIQYLQALATKITLDQQGRLVHRDTGKIILPYEHYANAVILKHMAGPGGMHLSMESTIKSVFESYSCGKDAFGFDRDFIIEVVNSCPSSSCRYFKGQQSVPSFEQPSPHQSFPNQSQMDYIQPTRQSPMMQPPTHDISKLNRSLSNQHQQMMQNRVMSQSMENLEKQRVMQQLDKKHYETVAAIVQANNNLGLPNQPMVPAANMMPQAHQHTKTMDYSRRPSYDGIETYSAASYATSNKELLHNNWATSSVPPVNFDRDIVAGQEKIVRAFAELMKNMARMKAFIRPSMVKPYGKQSENLQKSLMDSIQLVQTLRNFLPKPHISINNWKNVEAEVSIQ